MTDQSEAVLVHITGTNIPLGNGKRRERTTTATTFDLPLSVGSQPVVANILGHTPGRCRAVVLASSTVSVRLCTSLANAQSGAGAVLPDGFPVSLTSSSELWVSAVTTDADGFVSVIAEYE